MEQRSRRLTTAVVAFRGALLEARAATQELTLRRQNAALLLGDFLDLGLKLPVESLDGAVTFGAAQRQGGQLGKGRQQVEIVGAVRSQLLRTEDQQSQQLSLLHQGV